MTRPGFTPVIRSLIFTGMAMGALAAMPSLASAAGNAAAGKTLYTADCAVCHLASGAGGVKLGAYTSADLRAPALEKMYGNSDKRLADAILNGKDEEGKDMAPLMPRWKGQLSPMLVDDVIAYLKTLHK